jgi:hypothetical protein
VNFNTTQDPNKLQLYAQFQCVSTTLVKLKVFEQENFIAPKPIWMLRIHNWLERILFVSVTGLVKTSFKIAAWTVFENFLLSTAQKETNE